MQDKIASLPQELLLIIAHHLNRSTLAACTQVSHSWLEIFAPILWKDVDDGCRVGPYAKTRVQPLDGLAWMGPAFQNYARHIRRLRIHSTRTIELGATLDCRGLDSITLAQMTPYEMLSPSLLGAHNGSIVSNKSMADSRRNKTKPDIETIALDPEYLRTILQLPPSNELVSESKSTLGDDFSVQWFWILAAYSSTTLQRLCIENAASKAVMTFQDSTKLINCLHPFSKLRHLQIPRQDLDLDALLSCFPCLESLHLGKSGQFRNPTYTFRIPARNEHDDNESDSEHFPSLPESTLLPLLTDLTIEQDIQLSGIERLLEWRPTLKRLVFDSYNQDPTGFQDWPHETFVHGPQVNNHRALVGVESLQFTDQNTERQHRLARFLQFVPNLQELVLPTASDLTIDAIIEHCPEIKTLRHATDPIQLAIREPTPQNLHRLLETCVHLTVLDLIRFKIKISNFRLHINNNPWVCHGLEVFRCQIRGVPVSFGFGGFGGGGGGGGTERRASLGLQKKLFRQLGQLKRLRVLDFGYEERFHSVIINRAVQKYDIDTGTTTIEPGWKEVTVEKKPLGFEDTLQLTLESGLDQLESLKELRIFGFESLMHEIGEKELEWMVRSWPKLEVMRGLHPELANGPGSQAERKDQLRGFVQALKPSIAHESLFKLGRFWNAKV
ncbi:hypothetical protein BG004_003817 [Podila humilis]|nr:hypothetical protein BG004_003817 [Podila humilis]